MPPHPGGVAGTPKTLAACPEGSLSEQFLKWLAATTSLETDGSSLALNTDPESGALALLFELSK